MQTLVFDEFFHGFPFSKKDKAVHLWKPEKTFQTLKTIFSKLFFI